MAAALAVVKPAAADGAPVRVLLLGDSLTAGYGLPASQALPAQLQTLLRQRGREVEVINGGVSGDTLAGGRARLPWLLKDRPDVVVVALGGNDALRGLPPEQVARELDAILERLRQAGVGILLAGMRAPANFGPDYVSRFNRAFPEAAARHRVALHPFLLEGVALRPALNLDDGIHPNAQGVAVIARGLLPAVEAVIDGVLAARR